MAVDIESEKSKASGNGDQMAVVRDIVQLGDKKTGDLRQAMMKIEERKRTVLGPNKGNLAAVSIGALVELGREIESIAADAGVDNPGLLEQTLRSQDNGRQTALKGVEKFFEGAREIVSGLDLMKISEADRAAIYAAITSAYNGIFTLEPAAKPTKTNGVKEREKAPEGWATYRELLGDDNRVGVEGPNILDALTKKGILNRGDIVSVSRVTYLNPYAAYVVRMVYAARTEQLQRRAPGQRLSYSIDEQRVPARECLAVVNEADSDYAECLLCKALLENLGKKDGDGSLQARQIELEGRCGQHSREEMDRTMAVLQKMAGLICGDKQIGDICERRGAFGEFLKYLKEMGCDSDPNVLKMVQEDMTITKGVEVQVDIASGEVGLVS